MSDKRIRITYEETPDKLYRYDQWGDFHVYEKTDYKKEKDWCKFTQWERGVFCQDERVGSLFSIDQGSRYSSSGYATEREAILEEIEKQTSTVNTAMEKLKALNKKAKGYPVNAYKPMFLSWCKSYEQEVKELRELIETEPADVKQLKEEYQQLTGKRYRRKNG